MGKGILEEAVEEAKELQKAAEENAKNYLVEAMAPKIKEFISSRLGQEALDQAMALDAQGQNATETMTAGEQPAEMYEIEDGKDAEPDVELDLDSDDDDDKQKDDDADVEVDVNADEGHHKDMLYNDDDEYDKTEESVEVTTEDLQKAFAATLKNLRQEATLSPGKLGEPEDPNEGDIGLGGKLEKDKHWAEVVPQKVKMHAKEALEKRVADLSKELAEYKKAFVFLKKNLQEMNLFNAKLYFTNRLLQNNLTPKQKLSVVEHIDSATTKKEAEIIYKTLSETFKIAGSVNENKSLKGPKASRFTKPSSTLSENANQEQVNEAYDRMAMLAGITE